jgi:hypothetical protein
MKLLSIALMLGVVDSFDASMVSVEITDNRTEIAETVYMTFPESLFPCEVKEGSKFYFAMVKENIRIFCGDPPKVTP